MSDQHFHEGERRLQEQTGMRTQIDKLVGRLMHDAMPIEHRAFFGELEYILIGTIGADGLPYASMLTGEPGFAYSPNPKTLVIRTGPRESAPAFAALAVGEPVGVLGIDLSNRRRNRMHGRISAIDAHAITITVVQSYGNCPKYINLREISERNTATAEQWGGAHAALDSNDTAFITRADTFFIASFVKDGSGAPYEGVDVNHRGGQPGFVSVDDAQTLSIPDYRGNFLFNTFGNLLLNPSAGLLFIDFATGERLHLQGTAAIIEEGDEIARFPKAQRVLRIKITSVLREHSGISLRWRFLESSPFNPLVENQKS